MYKYLWYNSATTAMDEKTEGKDVTCEPHTKGRKAPVLPLPPMSTPTSRVARASTSRQLMSTVKIPRVKTSFHPIALASDMWSESR